MPDLIKHTCLDGRDRSGDEFDCKECRLLLLEVFRSPVVPEPTVSPEGPLPHLSVPADSARTVDLGLYHEPEGRTDPFPETDVRHVTDHGTEDDPDQPGGEWFVRCTCGHSETGHYTRDSGRQVADRLARMRAARHRENPTGETQ